MRPHLLALLPLSFLLLDSSKLLDPLTWPPNRKNFNIHTCTLKPHTTLPLPSPSPACPPWNASHYGPWFIPPDGGGMIGYCGGFVFAKPKVRKALCGQAVARRDVMRGWYVLAVDFFPIFQHDIINALPGAGMLLRWLTFAHKSLNITLICNPFVCDRISKTLDISFPSVPLIDRENSNIWIEHIVFSIPPFSEGVHGNNWDSYPCGTLTPFFAEYNKRPFVPSFPLRVLILSRSPKVSKFRILLNEDSLIARLRSISPSLHIDTFLHTDATADAATLQSADVVIGLHGGAFSNLVFCRKGTVVIEMSVPDFGGRQCFAYVAYNLGLRYHRYGQRGSMYESFTPRENFFVRNVEVNVDAFVSYLRDVLSDEGLLTV